MYSRDYMGTAFAWQVGSQWFHSPAKIDSPSEPVEVDRYLESGEIVLYPLGSGDGQLIRGARPWLTND
jgi:hypothetical protein